jgi:hypothetical protein
MLTVVVVKSSVFWDIMLCSPLKVEQHFGGTCDLHIQGWRISLARNQCEAGIKQTWFLDWFILRPRRWRLHVPPKCQFTFNKLHIVIFFILFKDYSVIPKNLLSLFTKHLICPGLQHCLYYLCIMHLATEFSARVLCYSLCSENGLIHDVPFTYIVGLTHFYVKILVIGTHITDSSEERMN